MPPPPIPLQIFAYSAEGIPLLGNTVAVFRRRRGGRILPSKDHESAGQQPPASKKRTQEKKEAEPVHLVSPMVLNTNHADQMEVLQRVRAAYATLDTRTRTLIEMKCAVLRRQRPMIHLGGQQTFESKYSSRTPRMSHFVRAYYARVASTLPCESDAQTAGQEQEEQQRLRDSAEREALFGALPNSDSSAQRASRQYLRMKKATRECGRLFRIIEGMRDGVPPPEDAKPLWMQASPPTPLTPPPETAHQIAAPQQHRQAAIQSERDTT